MRFFQEIFNYTNFKDILSYLADFIGFRSPVDIIRAIVDIGIVAYVIYRFVLLVKETRAFQLIKGVGVILVATYVSKQLGLKTIAYILENIIPLVGLGLVILFQPELRRGLEQLGRSRFGNIFSPEYGEGGVKTTAVIEEVIKAAGEMSRNFTGALIIMERETRIGDVINTGISLDSNVTSELLINIFVPNTPLHDGAVVIRDNKIKAAACFLPLTDNPNLGKELGTRHRAALGITEVSDAVAVVVSEETGKISFAQNGGLTRNLTPDTLRRALNKNLLVQKAGSKRLALWRVKAK